MRVGRCDVFSTTGASSWWNIRVGQHECWALLDRSSTHSFIDPATLSYASPVLHYPDGVLVAVGIGGQVIQHWFHIGGPSIPVVLGAPFFRQLTEGFPVSMMVVPHS